MLVSVRSAQAVLAVCILLGAFSALAGEPQLPGWATAGSEIGEGWKVTEVERHPEFIRVKSSNGQEVSSAEIRFRRADEPADGQWSTPHYLVQPAPGAAPSEAYLKLVLARLKAADSADGAVFVSSVKHVSGPENGIGSTWTAEPPDGIPVTKILSPAGAVCLAAVAFILLAFLIPGVPRRFAQKVSGMLGSALGRVFSILMCLFRLLDPSPERHWQDRPGRISLWWDVAATVLVGILAWYMLRAFLPPEMAIQIDQSSDLIYSRHFANAHEWPRIGPASSFGQLRQGNFIYLVWQTFLSLGVNIELSYPLMIAANALAAALVYVGFRRPLGILAALIAAAAFTFMNILSSGLTFVWIPSLLPVFVVAFFVVTTWFVQHPRWQGALVCGISLALAANVHIMTLLLLPVLAMACGMGGRTRAAGFAGVAFGALICTMVLLAPDSSMINAWTLAGSGWLLPSILGMVLMVMAGVVLSAQYAPSDIRLRGASFMHLATIGTIGILVGLSAVSGRHLVFRYLFPAVTGVAVLAGHLCRRYAGLMFTARPRVMRLALAAAAIVVTIKVAEAHPFMYLQQNVTLVTPTMRTASMIADSLADRGLDTWDMKWAVQTQEYTAFIRTIETFPPKKPAAGASWNGETAWQVMRLPSTAAAGRLPEGFRWFPLDDRSGVMLEEIRPWARRDRVEICFESIDPPSGAPACASADQVERPAADGIRDVNIVADDRVGPLQMLAGKAWSAFKPNRGSRIRMTYRIPLQPLPDDPEREIALVGGHFQAFGTEEAAIPTDWRIARVEGLTATTDPSGMKVTVRNSADGSAAGGVLVLERDMNSANKPSQEILPPAWFEIRPSGKPIWTATYL